MARWLLDCEPLCGHPWKLGLATTNREKEQAYRLRQDIFFRETGYGAPGRAEKSLDVDQFDELADHLVVFDVEQDRLLATCRSIPGTKAKTGNGFYGAHEVDLSPLDPIAPLILQGSRTCVDHDYREGFAIQYLTYGMNLLLREYDAQYLLGFESFLAKDPYELNFISSYLSTYGMDPDWHVEPRPACRIDGIESVPVKENDQRFMPTIIRFDLRLGFMAISPVVWDTDFRCHDVVMLGRRTHFTKMYRTFVDRVERPRIKQT
jgi:putative hemolysin